MDREHKKSFMTRAPNDSDTGVNDDFGELYFTAPITHGANALPNSWAGRWIELHVRTVGDVHYAFSTRSAAEVDQAVAATAAGASAKLGRVAKLNAPVRMRLPDIAQGETLYFVREAPVAATVQLSLLDWKQP